MTGETIVLSVLCATLVSVVILNLWGIPYLERNVSEALKKRNNNKENN
jgi:antibiotic biosynthesis monooxygenase (ABM) superfamily enzyme